MPAVGVGLAGRRLKAIAVGLEEVSDSDYLQYRITMAHGTTQRSGTVQIRPTPSEEPFATRLRRQNQAEQPSSPEVTRRPFSGQTRETSDGENTSREWADYNPKLPASRYRGIGGLWHRAVATANYRARQQSASALLEMAAGAAQYATPSDGGAESAQHRRDGETEGATRATGVPFVP